MRVELQTPLFGMGFDGVLRARRGDLVGILNGIDDEVWNPRDRPAHRGALQPAHARAQEAPSREAVQSSLGLDIDPSALLVLRRQPPDGPEGARPPRLEPAASSSPAAASLRSSAPARPISRSSFAAAAAAIIPAASG